MDTLSNSSVSAKDFEENENNNRENDNDEVEVEKSDKKFLSQSKIGKLLKVPHFPEEKIRSLDINTLQIQLKDLEERKTAQKKENINVGLLMDYMHQVYS